MTVPDDERYFSESPLDFRRHQKSPGNSSEKPLCERLCRTMLALMVPLVVRILKIAKHLIRIETYRSSIFPRKALEIESSREAIELLFFNCMEILSGDAGIGRYLLQLYLFLFPYGAK